MKVQKISIKNLRQIDEKVIEFGGCTAIVTGGNNKGKSTLLRSLPDRIRGLKPDNIVKFGETEGSAEWELTDGSKIVRSIDEKKKEKFSYILPNGLEVKDGVVKFLQEKYFGEGFDIDKFLISGPKIQQKMLQSLVGLDFEAIEEEYKKAYDERTEKNSILKNEKAKVVPSEFAEGKVELKDLQKIQSLINEGHEKNQEYNTLYQKSQQYTSQIDQKKKEIERINNEISLLEGHKKSVDEKIAETEKVDVTSLQSELNEAIEYNNKANAHNNSLNQTNIVAQAEKEAKESDDKVKEIEARKKEMIDNSKLPEGFTIGEEGVLYNNFPLNKESLSSSSLYIASLKLASMNIGELQTLFFDASYLDRNSLEEVNKRAIDNGLQLLIERPDRENGAIEYQIIKE